MLKEALASKKCLIVCGGGGVGKTTIAASLGIAATRLRKRVLVVTIDPSKRLAEAFGFKEESLINGGEPLLLSAEVKAKLGIAPENELSVGILNAKYVLNQIVEQTLTPIQQQKLKNTVLYANMSNMIYGLQEYTAYEWVTRMIQAGKYDFIVLDTPPAAHAKDFFNVPDKVKNLMESRVFQIFMPKKKNWFTSVMNFSWVEKLLGERIFSESRIFFETFATLRDRILERCEWLSRFFTQQEVAVVAVSTVEPFAQFELQGLIAFLKQKRIPLQSVILNQVEVRQSAAQDATLTEYQEYLSENPVLANKIKLLHERREGLVERAELRVENIKKNLAGQEMIVVSMTYDEDGFEILRSSSEQIQAF